MYPFPRRAVTIAALLAIQVVAPAIGQSPTPRKYALLAAVTKYNSAAMNEPVPLQFPEADAQSVADVLQQSGYEVDLLLGPQATRKAIQQKFDGLGSKGNREGVLVVGFWGHGVEIDGSNEAMFCPFDTTLRPMRDTDNSLVRDEETGEPLIEAEPQSLVSMAEVLIAMRTSGAGNRVLLADCCRNSPHIPRGRAFGSSIKLSDLPANTAALFACSSGERAFEFEPWGHGAFTKSLLELMPVMAANQDDVPAITGKLKRSVAEAVKTVSHGKESQTVHFINNGNPEMLLVKSGTPETMPVKPTSPPQSNKPTAPPNAAKSIKSRTTGMEFVFIPRGTFTMGSLANEEGSQSDETPHSVTISQDFYLGKYEVTQGEFQRVMGFNPSDSTGSDRLPVEQVNWYDAIQFCNQLSELDGRQAYYQLSGIDLEGNGDFDYAPEVPVNHDANGYRLPTEAEWEYACRAGTTTPFSFGANITKAEVNFDGRFRDLVGAKGEDREKTVAVDALPPNRFGLHHMHGNVQEWCGDWYGDYPVGAVTDPLGFPRGTSRVIRGGDWVGPDIFCRSANRGHLPPVTRAEGCLGFRVTTVR